MSPLVPLVMFGWIPAVLYLFVRFPAQRAVIISFIVAWLFLPQASFPIPSLPDYTKMSATCYGILLATVVFDSNRLSSFRLKWIDIPMLVWSFCPTFSSVTNGLGLYDGISASLDQFVTWGLPYFLGRLYLSNLAGLRQLAIAIFAGGLAYAPLCLYESRMSPQLHKMLYGFYAHSDFAQTKRMGGFRPMVFMAHGLAVGAWMMAATLVGIWLWRSGILKKFWGVSMKWLVGGLLVTFIMVKSTGAYLLLAFGVLILFGGKQLRTSIPLMILVGGISLYLFLGVTGAITPERRVQIITFMTQVTNAERADSLDFRLGNEELLGAKARQKMLFGWGGWGRARVYDEWGKDLTITDSLWIIAFGNYGAVGVISLTASMLMPALVFCLSRYPARMWAHPQIASAAVLTVVLTLFMLDCVLNAMLNPVYTLACGGISGLVVQSQPATPKKRPKSISTSAKKTLMRQK